MFVDDLAEVVDRVAPVTRTTIGKPEPTGRIAGIGNVGPISVRNIDSPQANRIQSEKNVASSQFVEVTLICVG